LLEETSRLAIAVTDAASLVNKMLGEAFPGESLVGDDSRPPVFVASTKVSESGLESG